MVKNLPAVWETGFYPWIGTIPWRRERLPTPVFWPRELHESMGYKGSNIIANFTSSTYMEGFYHKGKQKWWRAKGRIWDHKIPPSRLLSLPSFFLFSSPLSLSPSLLSFQMEDIIVCSCDNRYDPYGKNKSDAVRTYIWWCGATET